jgi:hypothetical protein
MHKYAPVRAIRMGLSLREHLLKPSIHLYINCVILRIRVESNRRNLISFKRILQVSRPILRGKNKAFNFRVFYTYIYIYMLLDKLMIRRRIRMINS